jgi:hypothetical protein
MATRENTRKMRMRTARERREATRRREEEERRSLDLSPSISPVTPFISITYHTLLS